MKLIDVVVSVEDILCGLWLREDGLPELEFVRLS